MSESFAIWQWLNDLVKDLKESVINTDWGITFKSWLQCEAKTTWQFGPI